MSAAENPTNNGASRRIRRTNYELCNSCSNDALWKVKCYTNTVVSTCHERPPPVRSESGPLWQVAAGYRDINLFPLIPACTGRPGLPLSPPETAFLESPYYRPQTASIGDRHRPTNFHSVTYTQTDDAAFEAGSDNDHKSFLRMRVIFKVEYPAELFRFRRVLDDILSSFDVF